MRIFFIKMFAISCADGVQTAEPNRQGIDFLGKIRPMLVTHCYECHSAEAVAKYKLKGGLLLGSREASQQEGESGPAIVPGKPDESLLINALQHVDFQMPPQGEAAR